MPDEQGGLLNAKVNMMCFDRDYVYTSEAKKTTKWDKESGSTVYGIRNAESWEPAAVVPEFGTMFFDGGRIYLADRNTSRVSAFTVDDLICTNRL
jgi:hypothetical protein